MRDSTAPWMARGTMALLDAPLTLLLPLSTAEAAIKAAERQPG